MTSCFLAYHDNQLFSSHINKQLLEWLISIFIIIVQIVCDCLENTHKCLYSCLLHEYNSQGPEKLWEVYLLIVFLGSTMKILFILYLFLFSLVVQYCSDSQLLLMNGSFKWYVHSVVDHSPSFVFLFFFSLSNCSSFSLFLSPKYIISILSL